MGHRALQDRAQGLARWGSTLGCSEQGAFPASCFFIWRPIQRQLVHVLITHSTPRPSAESDFIWSQWASARPWYHTIHPGNSSLPGQVQGTLIKTNKPHVCVGELGGLQLARAPRERGRARARACARHSVCVCACLIGHTQGPLPLPAESGSSGLIKETKPPLGNLAWNLPVPIVEINSPVASQKAD